MSTSTMSKHAIVIPILPADEIRAAADAGDWTRAAVLIAGHDHAVRAAWIDPPREQREDARWNALLAQQDALVLELPLSPLCSQDCAGLCVECGARLADAAEAHAHAAQHMTTPDGAAVPELRKEPEGGGPPAAHVAQ